MLELGEYHLYNPILQKVRLVYAYQWWVCLVKLVGFCIRFAFILYCRQECVILSMVRIYRKKFHIFWKTVNLPFQVFNEQRSSYWYSLIIFMYNNILYWTSYIIWSDDNSLYTDMPMAKTLHNIYITYKYNLIIIFSLIF